jgi:NitT/TauT family transport system substrate-binding protein
MAARFAVKRWSLAALAAVTLVNGTAAVAATIPDKAEAGSVRMAVDPWLGYGPWHIAQAQGFFKANGLSDVQLVNFNEDKDRAAAIAGGQVDVASIPTHTALLLAQSGVKLKIILLLDFSLSADAIASDKIGSIAQIKGQSVAYEEGSTSDILLNYALAQQGLTINDIKKVPMPAAQAGAALIAGQVPVSVTYEPYLTSAMNQNKKIKLIYSAGKDPGLVSDVLVATDDALQKHPGQVLALVKSWGQGLQYYRANQQAGRAIIAKAVGSSPADLASAFDGVQFYSIAENKAHLSGDFATKTLVDVDKAAVAAKILTGPVPTAGMIDDTFVVKAVK